jgi:hypothetical protein
MPKRNKPLRDLTVLFTGLAVLVLLVMVLTPAPDTVWLMFATLAALSLLGWTMYWRLPLHD